jgi:phage terminase small subunit
MQNRADRSRIIGHRLTPRQERFVAEYLVDLNATQAAVQAGYSKKTANKHASRLLANA